MLTDSKKKALLGRPVATYVNKYCENRQNAKNCGAALTLHEKNSKAFANHFVLANLKWE